MAASGIILASDFLNLNLNHCRHFKHIFRVSRTCVLGRVLGHNGVQGGDFYGPVIHHSGVACNDDALIGGIGVAGDICLNK